MNTYLITVYNASDCKIYDDCIIANDENEAIKRILDYITICDGDNIKIEEVAK